MNQREHSHEPHISPLAEINFRLQLPVWLVLFFVNINQDEWIYFCVLCWNWFTCIKNCLYKNIGKAEVDQQASEASGVEPFMAEVSGWKLLTHDVKGFLFDVIWSLNLLLNTYLRFWNFFINWPLLFEIFLRFLWHQ